MAVDTPDYPRRYSGELICGWVDDGALVALAEQLDVNPSVETRVEEDTQSKEAFAAKFVPQGIGYETTTELSRRRAQGQTWVTTSVERRLAAVLRHLTQEKRLFDLADEFAGRLFLSLRKEKERAKEEIPLPLSPSELFDSFGVKFGTKAHLCRRAREWIVAEGYWKTAAMGDLVRLELESIDHLLTRHRWPSDEQVTVDVDTKPAEGSGLVVKPRCQRELASGAVVRMSVFGSAQPRDGVDAENSDKLDGLPIVPVALFDRKGGDPFFTWRGHISSEYPPLESPEGNGLRRVQAAVKRRISR